MFHALASVASAVLPLSEVEAAHDGPNPYLVGGVGLAILLLLLLVTTRFNADR